jgi:hypothetical protein
MRFYDMHLYFISFRANKRILYLQIDIPETEPGYSFPEPPILNVDDIRPPILWYQDDEKDEEFDWSQLRAEHGHVGGDGNSLNNGNFSKYVNIESY